MLNDIQDGAFDGMPVSLAYINGKYGHCCEQFCSAQSYFCACSTAI